MPAHATTSASLEAGVGWHAGIARQRQPNEDSVVVLRGMCTYREQLVPFGLFVVADGMGGHDCGQEASRIAIRTLAQVTLREVMQPETLDDDQLIALLARAVEQANSAVFRRGQETSKTMGTTLTAALVVDTPASAMAYIVNAGDSRAYLLGKDERLQQITRDHSLVANLVAAKVITPDQVYTHPDRNKVFRSLGNNESLDIDWFTRELRSGDLLLLCSDGLWEMVRDPDIERILSQDREPTLLSNQLVQAALRGGGVDNVSAIVVRVG
jgi:serine/threonine protein phosphatase PrpC